MSVHREKWRIWHDHMDIHRGQLLACLVVDDVIDDWTWRNHTFLCLPLGFQETSMWVVIADLISVWSIAVGGFITNPFPTRAAYNLTHGFAEVLGLYWKLRVPEWWQVKMERNTTSRGSTGTSCFLFTFSKTENVLVWPGCSSVCYCSYEFGLCSQADLRLNGVSAVSKLCDHDKLFNFPELALSLSNGAIHSSFPYRIILKVRSKSGGKALNTVPGNADVDCYF